MRISCPESVLPWRLPNPASRFRLDLIWHLFNVLAFLGPIDTAISWRWLPTWSVAFPRRRRRTSSAPTSWWNAAGSPSFTLTSSSHVLALRLPPWSGELVQRATYLHQWVPWMLVEMLSNPAVIHIHSVFSTWSVTSRTEWVILKQTLKFSTLWMLETKMKCTVKQWRF